MPNSAIRRHICETVARSFPGAMVVVAERKDNTTNVVVKGRCSDCGVPLTFGLSLVSDRLPEYLINPDHVVRTLEQAAVAIHP